VTVKIQVGPPQIAIHQGQTVLISEEDGQINWPSEKGLYFFDTRVISSWAIYANGAPWELLNGGPISYYASPHLSHQSRFAHRRRHDSRPRTLGLTLSRSISGGMHEDLDIINHGMNPAIFQLEIALRCDFADVFEVKSGHIRAPWPDCDGVVRIAPASAQHLLQRRLHPRADHFLRRESSTKAVYANGRLSFEVALKPGEPWHCCLRYTLTDGDPASGFAASLHWPQPQIAPRPDDGGLARKCRQDRDQQRGILSPVSPGT